MYEVDYVCFCLGAHVGGETIRQLQVQSGAHIELHRGAHPNPAEKLFNIRGETRVVMLHLYYTCSTVEKSLLQLSFFRNHSQTFVHMVCVT